MTRTSESSASYQYTGKPTRTKHAKIIAIVEQNPGITGAEIIRQYHAADVVLRDKHQGVRNMLLNLCVEDRLKYLEGDRYTIPPHPQSTPTNVSQTSL